MCIRDRPTTDSVKAKPVEKKASQSDVAADKKMDLLSTLNEASEEKVSAQEKEVVEVKEPAKAEPRKEEMCIRDRVRARSSS